MVTEQQGAVSVAEDNLGTRVVLVVDDDAAMRETLSDALTAAGYQVETSADGASGLACVQRGRVDLILLDRMLPDIDGRELCRRMRTHEHDAYLPILMLSARDDEASRHEGFLAGVDDYVTKPFTIDNLLDRVAVWLRMRQMLKAATGIQQGQTPTLETHLAAVFHLAEAAILTKRLDGTVMSWNPAAEQLYGYTAAEIVGCSVDLIIPPDRHDEYQEVLTHLREGRRVDHLETVRLHKDGRRIDVSLSSSPVRDAEGTLVGAAMIALDITARKQAEAEHERLLVSERAARADLLQAQSRLIQQERLRALGEMASGIAHDFNNALAPMLGYSELLLDRPALLDDRETLTEYLQLINTGAHDAARVVSRLREFYRARDPHEHFEPVQLNALVEQAVDLTRPRWSDQAQATGAQIRVETRLHGDPTIAGDAAELREALTNLIFNAADALSEGGTITLTTREQGEQVLLSVSDTGPGMSAEVRQRCLEPFFTTKGERGTGLGLAMVYGIIQRHGGTLEIDSAPGQGTTIRIGFPAGTEHGAASVAEVASAPSRSLHVLVADDDDQVRAVTVAYLESDGHRVETAADGVAALAQFLRSHFDLVLTDRAMPAMGGDQLAMTIKRLSPTTPVIMMTGFGDLMEGERPPGVDALVSKPATPEMLRRTIADVLAGATDRDEEPAAE
jgi:PAS domain S-box-containing protein